MVLDDASRLASHIGGLLGAAGVAHGHRDVGAYQGFQGHLVRLLLAHDLDHAVGERGHVVAVLAAAAAGIDGLFLEVHDRPEQAKCDGPNMIPLAELSRLLAVVLEIDRAVRDNEEA